MGTTVDISRPASADLRSEAQARLEAIQRGLAQAEEALNWMVDHQGWLALGFDSFESMWDSMDMRKLKLAKVARKRIVELLKASGLSNRRTAEVLGVDETTVRRDLGSKQATTKSTAAFAAPGESLTRPQTVTPAMEDAVSDLLHSAADQGMLDFESVLAQHLPVEIDGSNPEGLLPIAVEGDSTERTWEPTATAPFGEGQSQGREEGSWVEDSFIEIVTKSDLVAAFRTNLSRHGFELLHEDLFPPDQPQLVPAHLRRAVEEVAQAHSTPVQPTSVPSDESLIEELQDAWDTPMADSSRRALQQRMVSLGYRIVSRRVVPIAPGDEGPAARWAHITDAQS